MWGGFWRRLRAIVVKEVQQLRRDRLTFAMMFGVPIMQLLLFGYAIDTDPHNLPAAVISADDTTVTRTIVSALSSTGYMTFTQRPHTEAEANALLQRGEVQFVVTIPSDFTRRLVRGERAQVLIDADATDPLASPLQGQLSGLPPVRIHVGDDEVLLDDSRRYVERAVAAGVDARLEVWMGMPHGFVAIIGMVKAATLALDAIGTFLTERLQTGHP